MPFSTAISQPLNLSSISSKDGRSGAPRGAPGTARWRFQRQKRVMSRSCMKCRMHSITTFLFHTVAHVRVKDVTRLTFATTATVVFTLPKMPRRAPCRQIADQQLGRQVCQVSEEHMAGVCNHAGKKIHNLAPSSHSGYMRSAAGSSFTLHSLCTSESWVRWLLRLRAGLFFFGFRIHNWRSTPSTSRTHTDGGAVINSHFLFFRHRIKCWPCFFYFLVLNPLTLFFGFQSTLLAHQVRSFVRSHTFYF